MSSSIAPGGGTPAPMAGIGGGAHFGMPGQPGMGAPGMGTPIGNSGMGYVGQPIMNTPGQPGMGAPSGMGYVGQPATNPRLNMSNGTPNGAPQGFNPMAMTGFQPGWMPMVAQQLRSAGVK